MNRSGRPGQGLLGMAVLAAAGVVAVAAAAWLVRDAAGGSAVSWVLGRRPVVAGLRRGTETAGVLGRGHGPVVLL